MSQFKDYKLGDISKVKLAPDQPDDPMGDIEIGEYTCELCGEPTSNLFKETEEDPSKGVNTQYKRKVIREFSICDNCRVKQIQGN